MLCQRCARLIQAGRPLATPTKTPTGALPKFLPSHRQYFSSRTTTIAVPLSSRLSARHLAYQKSAAAAAAVSAYHTSSSLARPATSPVESEPSSSPSTLEKPDFLDDAESLIWDRLIKEFSPVELVVQDISGGCGSMYGIEISSEKFRGATMLKQQRMVNAVLGDLMKEWHGVQLKTRVP